VSALFAALLTKVGVYALLRVTAGVFPPNGRVHDALVIVAIATMIVGVMGALARQHLRRILSFHIVSQIGYMVAGVAVADASPAARRFAIAATIFYIVHHILVKANLFLIAGIVRHVRGTESLGRLGGLARAHPWLAGLFLISALSLAGVPPLSGFWAKLSIIAAALERDRVALAIVAAAVGLLTLTSMIKIWNGAFAGRPGESTAPPRTRRELGMLYAGSAVLAALTLTISVAPDTLFQLALGAADQLGPPSHAITLLGDTP
jgi:multicomponent Na+:H+ antiporter subunit D